jgi:GTP-binding protein
MVSQPPVIAIIGRPNVGKSTLFNRMVGGRRAIVDDRPGVTRDRITGECEWLGRRFTVVDTGGLDPGAETGLPAQIKTQACAALVGCDVVVLVVDALEGLTPADAEVARLLRRRAKAPLVLAVNKVDTAQAEPLAADFASLGIDPAVPVAAESGRGVDDLLDHIAALIPLGAEAPSPEAGTTVAIVGRPNVGKSSLLNRLLGEERVVVSPEPGTTRDAVDTRVTVGGRAYTLIDTAGIRARGKLTLTLERAAVARAVRAMERADVALILLDAVEGITDQDTKIAGLAQEAGCAAVLVVNKWDAAAPDRAARADRIGGIRDRLRYLAYAPLVTVSALTGLRALSLFDVVDRVAAQRAKRVPTAELNEFLREALDRRPPPAGRGRAVKVRYATQAGVKPPTFVLFANVDDLHFSYRRYLVNCLREAYGFEGSPIRLVVRRSGGRPEGAG